MRKVNLDAIPHQSSCSGQFQFSRELAIFGSHSVTLFSLVNKLNSFPLNVSCILQKLKGAQTTLTQLHEAPLRLEQCSFQNLVDGKTVLSANRNWATLRKIVGFKSRVV